MLPGLGIPAGMFKAAAAAGGPVVPTFTAYVSGGIAVSPTFSGVAIGTASANRYVTFAYVASNDAAATAATATVNGAACTKVAVSTGDGRPCAIFITNAPVTSGTTATIAINTGGNNSDNEIAVYALTGTSAPTTPTVYTDNAAPLSQTISIPSGGAAIGAANLFTSATWTGLTKDSDGTSGNYKGSVASSTTAGSPTVTATGSGGSSNLCVAVWSP